MLYFILKDGAKEAFDNIDQVSPCPVTVLRLLETIALTEEEPHPTLLGNPSYVQLQKSINKNMETGDWSIEPNELATLIIRDQDFKKAVRVTRSGIDHSYNEDSFSLESLMPSNDNVQKQAMLKWLKQPKGLAAILATTHAFLNLKTFFEER